MKRSELLSRILVVTGVLIVLAAPFAARAIGAQGVVEIHGWMAESGGWTPSTIRAQAGVTLHLRLTSDDVMHSFAIGQSDTPAVDVLPGQMTEVTLTFDKPGTYTYYCTRWCGPNHWRMRGTIEVTGDDFASPQPGTPPLYMTLNLDIDAAHPASVTPIGFPDAQRGVTFSTLLPVNYLSLDYYRSHSPAQAVQELRADPALASLSNSDLWDLVAYIWQSNTTPEGLAEGQRLFAQNCAACHGETGRGNGVFSGDIKALAGKTPANFSDPATMLGAGPALLQGKILRGGMGTGMPSWGPIFADQQTWDLVSYLYTIQFRKDTSGAGK
ncbi:MAG: c-type cytochrome [Chloroflexi bacterium]|nr:c-type cytochrome [Chloroflexota bacterium]